MNDESLHIPADERALSVLRSLEAAGASAWLVGGCVRDAIAGRAAHDFDIATSARWQDVRDLFAARGSRVIETGSAHGSVTVIADGLAVEVTTYRVESGYSDARRPDAVAFVDDIEADLARRDFRMNAAAYHPERGLFDPFGARADIEAKKIRCVGRAEERFAEDPLRIMRAVRLCAQLGFTPDADTHAALLGCADSLGLVAKERLFCELSKLVCAPFAGAALRLYPDVIERVIGGFSRLAHLPASGSSSHANLLEETADALDRLACEPPLRFAALLDAATAPEPPKARRATCDEAGRRNAYDLLRRLKAPRRLIDSVCALIEGRRRLDAQPDADIGLVAASYDGDVSFVRDLLALGKARAGAAGDEEAFARIARRERSLARLEAAGTPLSRGDLAVSGSDLIASGMRPGPGIAQALDALLRATIGGAAENTRESLLALLPAIAASHEENGEEISEKMRRNG